MLLCGRQMFQHSCCAVSQSGADDCNVNSRGNFLWEICSECMILNALFTDVLCILEYLNLCTSTLRTIYNTTFRYL
jgi:hypothetical protein